MVRVEREGRGGCFGERVGPWVFGMGGGGLGVDHPRMRGLGVRSRRWFEREGIKGVMVRSI